MKRAVALTALTAALTGCGTSQPNAACRRATQAASHAMSESRTAFAEARTGLVSTTSAENSSRRALASIDAAVAACRLP